MNDLIVLALLLDGPRYGYRLKAEAGALLGQAPAHSNTIYPMLARFAAEGWVRRQAAPGERGQTRLLYSLTAAGRRQLLRQLEEFPEQKAEREGAFELRVSLFGVLDAAARARILDAREAVLRERAERLEAIAGRFPVEGFAAGVLEHRRQRLALERRWIAALRRQIKEDVS